MPEVDFTTAHFLGLAPSGTTGPLTSGRPAVVEDVAPGTGSAQRYARLHDGPGADGMVARSSLHALVDVLQTRPPGAVVLVDEAIYPVGRWAAEAVAADVVAYPHHDARRAARLAPRRRTAVLLTDGLCGSCLRPAPLTDLAEVAARCGGELVVDDSLAAGVLGPRTREAPLLGSPLTGGGSGTAAWLGATETGQVTVASLAKGLSTPLAVVVGPRARIDRVRRDGPTQTHCSPPTCADLAALDSALRHRLETRRARLAATVDRVRDLFESLGLRPIGIPFPVVATEGGRQDPLELHRALAHAGIRTLATQGRCTDRPSLSLCLRADQPETDLSRLATALGDCVRRAA